MADVAAAVLAGLPGVSFRDSLSEMAQRQEINVRVSRDAGQCDR